MLSSVDKSLNARLKDKVIWDVHHIVRSEIISPVGDVNPNMFLIPFNAHFNNGEHSINAKLKGYRFKPVGANKPG